jgi:hypothetical protein
MRQKIVKKMKDTYASLLYDARRAPIVGRGEQEA